jgi:hypothetical protein
MDHQHLAGVHNKDGDGEINVFVDVWHGDYGSVSGRTLG